MPITTPTLSFDWEDIIDALEDEKCILFLGPGAFRADDGTTLETLLHRELDAADPDHPFIRAFYENEGFFLFRKELYRRKIIRKIQRFFEQPPQASQALLEKIARIPFHIIITLTPDGLLSRTFDHLQLPHHHDFYHKNQKPKAYLEPRSGRPLIYNMLGYVEEHDSLILTHNDLFDYLNSIFTGKSMQPELRQQLKQAHSYIFLGLPYEKWYLQLLMRVLSLHAQELKNLERYASNPTVAMKQQLKRLFENEFNIEFVPNNPTDFIEELYSHCDGKGLLRELPAEGAGAGNYRHQLSVARKLFRENEILSGIETLREVLEANTPKCNHLRDELTLQERNFRSLSGKILQNMATEGDRIELNQVLFALINLISQTENCLAS